MYNASKILREGEGKCILAASQGLQEAYALEEHNHSLYTYYLLQGLKGDESSVDDNGFVTPDSLSKFAYNQMMSLPPDRRPRQKPVRKVEASGDIILAHYPQYAKMIRKNEGRVNQEINELQRDPHSEILLSHPKVLTTNIDEMVKRYVSEKKT